VVNYRLLTNGLIKQWGYALGDEVNVVLPIPYKIRYSISLSLNYHSNFDGWSRTGTYEVKTLKGFHISICIRNEGAVSDWTTIGF